MMHLNATQLHNMLCERPGRYIEERMGTYLMKEADGTHVTAVAENGEAVVLCLPEVLIDQLYRESHLTRDGTKYFPVCR